MVPLFVPVSFKQIPELARRTLRPGGEMDITADFGSAILGSNPGRGTLRKAASERPPCEMRGTRLCREAVSSAVDLEGLLTSSRPSAPTDPGDRTPPL